MKAAVQNGGIAGGGRALARVFVLMVVFGGLTVGCSEPEETAACSDAAIDFSLPTESFTDWVSYADQLSVVTVLADRKLIHTPDSGAPPDKYVGRSVDIRVTETAWRRPDAPIAPDRLWMVTDFPGEDGRLGDTCSERPTLNALAGLTVDAAARMVAGTQPDPRAATQAHLPPKQRYQVVQSGVKGRGSGGTVPGVRR